MVSAVSSSEVPVSVMLQIISSSFSEPNSANALMKFEPESVTQCVTFLAILYSARTDSISFPRTLNVHRPSILRKAMQAFFRTKLSVYQ